MDDRVDKRYDFVMSLSDEDKEKLVEANNYSIKLVEYSIKEREQNYIVAPKWGEIWKVDLGINAGSEMNKVRPCIIVSYKSFNNVSGLATVIPITHSEEKYNTQFIVDESILLYPCDVNGIAKAEQITTKSKARFKEKLGELNKKGCLELKKALLYHENLEELIQFL